MTIIGFAIVGILVNMSSFAILQVNAMRTSFNFILMAGAIFDCGYLLVAFLESMRKNFDVVSHTKFLPKILYPSQVITITASIFLTVGLAKERFDAVNQPITYNQVINLLKIF